MYDYMSMLKIKFLWPQTTLLAQNANLQVIQILGKVPKKKETRKEKQQTKQTKTKN